MSAGHQIDQLFTHRITHGVIVRDGAARETVEVEVTVNGVAHTETREVEPADRDAIVVPRTKKQNTDFGTLEKRVWYCCRCRSSRGCLHTTAVVRDFGTL